VDGHWDESAVAIRVPVSGAIPLARISAGNSMPRA